MAKHQKRHIITKFETIREKSIQIRRQYQKLKTAEQIVCIVKMSEEELLDEEFPANPVIKDYVNKKIKSPEMGRKIQQLHTKKEVHGEIIALHLDDYLLDIEKKYSGTSTEESGKPYVFIYSHFLPCAGLEKYPFACAEELAKHALLTRDIFNMLVGYTKVFSYTDRDLAVGYLHHDSIYALVNLNDPICEMNKEDSFFTPQINILQEKFYKCIFESITCQDCKASESTKFTIRDKINLLIKIHISKQIKEGRGPLTLLDLNMLQTSFKEEKWFSICSHDSTSQSQTVATCFEEIKEDSYKDHTKILVLGQPFDTEPFWRISENISMEWSKLYHERVPEPNANGIKRPVFSSQPEEHSNKYLKLDETKLLLNEA